VETLHSASDALTRVAQKYSDREQDTVHHIKRSEQPR
jgi:hypothetical protein